MGNDLRRTKTVWRLAIALACTCALALAMVGSAKAAITFVTCPLANLQNAINAAHSGDTLLISGTCRGNFSINAKNLTLAGLSATLDGQKAGTTLTVSGSSTVSVSNLTITGGQSSTAGGGIEAGSGTTVKVTASSVSGNSTTFRGGGIDANHASLTLVGTSVSGNTGDGAGIFGLQSTINLSSSAVNNNVAPVGSQGGGIFVDQGSLTVGGSNVVGNRCLDPDASGGGIFGARASISIDNSTVSSNAAPDNGGGIFYEGGPGLTVSNSTVANNSASVNGGAGIFNLSFAADAPLSIVGSTISGNTAAGGNGGGVANYGGYGHQAQLTIQSSTLTRNISPTGWGGDIYTSGSFLGSPAGAGLTTVTGSSVLTGGQAQYGGGLGIDPRGGSATATLLDTAVLNNTATGDGGGIDNAPGGLLNLGAGVSFTGNRPNDCVGQGCPAPFTLSVSPATAALTGQAALQVQYTPASGFSQIVKLHVTTSDTRVSLTPVPTTIGPQMGVYTVPLGVDPGSTLPSSQSYPFNVNIEVEGDAVNHVSYVAATSLTIDELVGIDNRVSFNAGGALNGGTCPVGPLLGGSCFSVQQNFFIHLPGQPLATYWGQNVTVLETSLAGTWAKQFVNIFNINNLQSPIACGDISLFQNPCTLPAVAYLNPLGWLLVAPPYNRDTSIDMTTFISGGELKLQVDGSSTIDWPLPSGSFLDSRPQTERSDPSQAEPPELVMVGACCLAKAAFLPFTNGSVQSLVQTMGNPEWTNAGAQVVVGSDCIGTGERSLNLDWMSMAGPRSTFAFRSGGSDQGLAFVSGPVSPSCP